MIFFSCTLVGAGAARIYRLRVSQLEAFLRLISHIKAQIDYFCSPLDNIIEKYEDERLSACGFMIAAKELGVCKGFESCRDRLLITEDEADLLSDFFDGLGKHHVGEERVHCEYFEKLIGSALERERSELSRRSKLCRTFGMLVGFLMAVMLI